VFLVIGAVVVGAGLGLCTAKGIAATPYTCEAVARPEVAPMKSGKERYESRQLRKYFINFPLSMQRIISIS
jgi:hypothetical protein